MIYIDDDIAHLDLEASLPLLSEERRKMALRYKHDTGRRQCAAAWLLLLRVLTENYGLKEMPPMAYTEKGKPYFPSMPDLHFNMSHCKEAVAVAVADHPVGIDIETIRPVKVEFLRYVMNESELNRIFNASQPEMEFTKLWTMKESMLKLTGIGISNNMKPVLEHTEKVRFETLFNPSERYICTLATYFEEWEEEHRNDR